MKTRNQCADLKSSAAFALLVLLAGGQPAHAGVLTLKNGDQNKSTTFTMPHAGEYHCVNGVEHFVGKQYVVGPGETVKLEIQRGSHGGCDGEPAAFSVYVEQKQIAFWMHGDGGFVYHSQPGKYDCPDSCLIRDPITHGYTFTTKVVEKTKANIGKPRGEWKYAGGGGQKLTRDISMSLDIGTYNESSWNKEVSSELAVTIEAGVEFGPASASTSISRSKSQSTGEAASIARSKDRGFTESCGHEIEWQGTDVQHAWQWSVNTPVDGANVVISTCFVACTREYEAPTFTPANAPFQSCVKTN